MMRMPNTINTWLDNTTGVAGGNTMPMMSSGSNKKLEIPYYLENYPYKGNGLGSGHLFGHGHLDKPLFSGHMTIGGKASGEA